MCWGSEKSHSVGRLKPPKEARRSKDKFRSEYFRWTYFEQVQHCTDLPLQVTFPANTEQEKTGPGLGRRLPLIRRSRIRTPTRERQEKRRQATDFTETECFPFAVVQRAARQKMIC